MREAILLNGYPPRSAQSARESDERVAIPSPKTSVAFVGGQRRRAIGSDLFEVSEQFHEPRFIRITDGRFTVWLHPFGMLDSEVVMDLLPKLGVSVNAVSLRHCLVKTQVYSRTVLPKPRRHRRPTVSR